MIFLVFTLSVSFGIKEKISVETVCSEAYKAKKQKQKLNLEYVCE